jgi:hypothetical protein
VRCSRRWSSTLCSTACEVPPDRVDQIGVPVESLDDLIERQPEPPQRHYLVEPPDVLLRIQPPPRLRSLVGHQQSDRVVVMERTHGQAGRLCKRTDLDLPGCVVGFGHDGHRACRSSVE